jgi:hypothetical protein
MHIFLRPRSSLKKGNWKGYLVMGSFMLFLNALHSQGLRYTPDLFALEDSTQTVEPSNQPELTSITPLPKLQPALETAVPTVAKESLKERPARISMFGYYRLFAGGFLLDQAFPNMPVTRAYGVGDGYREPMLSLNVFGRPNGRSSFGTELFVFTPYAGVPFEENDNQFTLNLGINFYGNFRTQHGKFGIRAGGIHWYNLSPFTIGVYQILDRFSIFDRTPWEGISNTGRYEGYYGGGDVNRGDLRWDFRPFQGLIINGGELPGDLAFDLFWGKIDLNGGLPGSINDPSLTVANPGNAGNIPIYTGFNGTARNTPNFLTGGKLVKNFEDQNLILGYNAIYNHTALDTLGRANRNFQVHTLTLNMDIGDLNISGELGGGAFQSPTYERQWGEALMLRFKTKKEMTFLPLDLQVYQISPNYFNPNGEINTDGNPEIQANLPFAIAAGQLASGGLVTQVNQLAHNRRGINLNTGVELGDLKFNLGWGIAHELEAITTQLSFNHRINGLALSRIFQPFPANATTATVVGPYNRAFSFFRGVFEVVRTTDAIPGSFEASSRKWYSMVDLQGKYKTMIAGRPLYFFYLGTLSSVDPSMEIVPRFTQESYLFVQYHEFDLYYELLPKFILTGYYGVENARGGRLTEWGETGIPRDQLNTGWGLGFDWTVAPNSAFYFRYRRMQFNDRSFELARLKGHEITVELKTFF